MNMRTILDQRGSNNPLIDKRIGNAYPVVEAVARHLAEIAYVAANLDKLRPQDVEFQSSAEFQEIQWRYVGDQDWKTLVSYADLLGEDVPEVVRHLNAIRDEIVILENSTREYADDAFQSKEAAAQSATEAAGTELRADAIKAKEDAQAAAAAAGPVAAFYDTYALALSDASGPKRLVEIARDETRSGARTRYWAENGVLSFALNVDQLRNDLADSAQGSELIGYEEGTVQDVLNEAKPMQSYAALRAYTGRAAGVRITTPGIAGYFQRSATDITSPDTTGTVIVDALGRRWLRLYSGFVNVKWFGAKGDGVTDDTIAIAGAVYWVSYGVGAFKRTLLFPAGVYITTERVHVNTPMVVIRGEGRYNSVIKFTGVGIAVHFNDEDPNNGVYAFGGGIEDICIEGNSEASSLLYVKYVNHFRAVNVNLREASTTVGVGLHVLGTVLGYFENVYCSTNSQLMTSRPQNGLIVDRDPTSMSRATANTFVHCVFEGMVGDGIQLVNSDQSMFVGGTSENNTGNGLTIAAGSRMNTFISVAFEHGFSTTFADISDSGFSNRFINCYTKKLIYIAPSAQFSKVEGGFHQSIVDEGDFSTLQDLKYSFFGDGGNITIGASTSTKNLFNVETSSLTFFKKPPIAQVVTVSPYAYTNQSGLDEEVIVNGGAVTQIVFERGGPIAYLPVSGMFRLAPGDKLVISYTDTPTVVAVPFGTNYT